MVTITIVVLVTGVIMIRYSSFNSSVLLSGQAYITAFDIREAQSLAVSVRGNQNEFREEYGLYFDASNAQQYILFQDDDSNGIDDPAQYHSSEAIGNPYKIDSRFQLVDLCATSGGVETCSLSDLAISFQRPDFDAHFYSSSAANIDSVEIIIGSNDSALTRSVVVYASGQISVE